MSWYGTKRPEQIRSTLRSVRLQSVRLRQVAIPQTAPELLINLGSGTAADLKLLHRSVVDQVKRVRGEDLASRIRFVGSAS